jgi:hypothetical protein
MEVAPVVPQPEPAVAPPDPRAGQTPPVMDAGVPSTSPVAPPPAPPAASLPPRTFKQGFARGGAGQPMVADAQGNVVPAPDTTAPSRRGTFGQILASMALGALQGATAARPGGIPSNELGGGFGAGAERSQEFFQARDLRNRGQAERNLQNTMAVKALNSEEAKKAAETAHFTALAAEQQQKSKFAERLGELDVGERKEKLKAAESARTQSQQAIEATLRKNGVEPQHIVSAWNDALKHTHKLVTGELIPFWNGKSGEDWAANLYSRELRDLPLAEDSTFSTWAPDKNGNLVDTKQTLRKGTDTVGHYMDAAAAGAKQLEDYYSQELNDAKIEALRLKGEGTTDTDRYIRNWLAAKGLPNTPENWGKAHAAYTEETKLKPAEVRATIYAESRGMPVTDTKTGVTSPMSWEDYNKKSKEEPGRYTSPQYDPATQTSITAWKGLAKGATHDQLVSYDAFLRHSGDLYDAVGSLNNTNFPFMNKTINWMRNNTGDPRVKTFLAKLDPVQKEFESFLLNNRALYKEDREKANEIINENSTPAQMLGVLPSIVHTGSARLSAVNSGFRRSTISEAEPQGVDIPNLVSPEAEAVMRKMNVTMPSTGGGAAGSISVKDPLGGTHIFPDQKSADAFKKAANIQ